MELSEAVLEARKRASIYWGINLFKVDQPNFAINHMLPEELAELRKKNEAEARASGR